MGLLHPEPMSLQDRNDKGCLRWKVVMNARFPNVNGFRDVSVTEGRKTSLR